MAFHLVSENCNAGVMVENSSHIQNQTGGKFLLDAALDISFLE